MTEVADYVDLDLADVRGQRDAKRALEILAAGHHHVLLVGPPGTGKTMLALRIASILPDTTGSIRAPHHTCSPLGMMGTVRDQRVLGAPPETRCAIAQQCAFSSARVAALERRVRAHIEAACGFEIEALADQVKARNRWGHDEAAIAIVPAGTRAHAIARRVLRDALGREQREAA